MSYVSSSQKLRLSTFFLQQVVFVRSRTFEYIESKFVGRQTGEHLFHPADQFPISISTNIQHYRIFIPKKIKMGEATTQTPSSSYEARVIPGGTFTAAFLAVPDGT